MRMHHWSSRRKTGTEKAREIPYNMNEKANDNHKKKTGGNARRTLPISLPSLSSLSKCEKTKQFNP